MAFPNPTAQLKRVQEMLGMAAFFERVCGVPKLTAEGVGTRDNSHIGKLKIVLSRRCEERMTPMTNSTENQDRSFPYLLVCSTLATVVSLASVWIATAVSYAPTMVA